METKEKLLKSIQERREFLNISQQELADTLQISQGQFSSLMSGRSEISLQKFILLCERLGLNIDVTGVEQLEEIHKQQIIEEIISLAEKLRLNNYKL